MLNHSIRALVDITPDNPNDGPTVPKGTTGTVTAENGNDLEVSFNFPHKSGKVELSELHTTVGRDEVVEIR